jgi:hypothetical protein
LVVIFKFNLITDDLKRMIASVILNEKNCEFRTICNYLLTKPRLTQLIDAKKSNSY